MREIEESHPEAEKVELWAEEEAQLGLKPLIRRVWAPVGKRPVARFKRGYEWTYLYGFVRSESGEMYWLLLPTVNVGLLDGARSVRQRSGGGQGQAYPLGGRSGWVAHRPRGWVQVLEGIHLEFLPSGSPELQPAERLWPLTNEAMANGIFEEIEEALMERCVEQHAQSEYIRNLTNYHWWPQAA